MKIKEVQIIKIANGEVALSLPIAATLSGMIAATVSGYLSIKVMLRLVQKCKLKYFGVYLIALSAIVAINNFTCWW